MDINNKRQLETEMGEAEGTAEDEDEDEDEREKKEEEVVKKRGEITILLLYAILYVRVALLQTNFLI